MQSTNTADIIGVGWAFPVGVDSRGRVALARQQEDIDQAIRMILLTPKGQRVMRPEFGCQIHDLIFAPNDATTFGLAAFYVEEALAFWEPRIRVESVTAAPDPADSSRLLVSISYEVKATYDQRALVFPFYRIPGEAGALPAAVSDGFLTTMPTASAYEPLPAPRGI
jgi:phage baseplate assembly protein W